MRSCRFSRSEHHSSDPIIYPKKRRRVGFSKTDAGIEANDCITIYLVSSKEDVDSPNSFCLEPIVLNLFFEDDGRIFGYPITVWVSLISFHAHADISFESSSDGGRGITNLKSSLQNIFAESLVDERDAFLQTFSTESHYVWSFVSNAEALQHKVSNGCCTESKCLLKSEPSDVEVFWIIGMPVGHLYSRLVPPVLLLVDGSNPIDILDPRWEIYLLVQERKDTQEDSLSRLLGFAAVYRFHRYPESTRVRLGQVLNRVAISEDVYDLTIEEPEDSLQHVRSCIDVERLLVFDPIQQSLESVVSRLKQENPSKKNLHVQAEVVGKDTEGNGKQVIDVLTEYDQQMSFVMFKSQNGESSSIEKADNQSNVEEQLQKLVDERMNQIKLIAEKVSVHRQ
ncbi:hypothetical protein RND71_031971 [Anisodus tanguticus]|uniref:histone acetyltransferase n=1 Tax=Anisodus tanguticus TaxID=243964 RepID=A0AAE1RCB2_9SOLA|nr:hypothetical protein RND71_031971 [Anisodus tanguticus]